MYQLAEALFPTRGRRAVLLALFGPGSRPATVSELARRAGLTARAVAVEVRRLASAGVVEVEARGAADLVQANRRSPGARNLARLLRSPASEESARDPRPSLVAYGAPLAGVEPKAEMRREEALVAGLRGTRTDPTLLRVLPVMLLRNEEKLDWNEVRSRAGREKLKSELGLLLDLTAEVAGKPGLHARTRGLLDRRRRVPRYLPEPANEFERRLADKRTPAVVRRWGFRANVSEDSVGEFVRKHLA